MDKKEIQSLIKKIESQTSAEIVPAILKNSDNYPAAYYRSGLFFSSLAFIITYFFFREFIVYAILIGYLIGLVLSFIPFVKKLFIFKPEIEEETLQKAYEIFLEHKIHQTSNRSGVLVMLSIFEKRAIILADKNINTLVQEDTWVKVIDKLTLDIRTQSIESAFKSALNKCGDILIEQLPHSSNDKNELSDSLVKE